MEIKASTIAAAVLCCCAALLVMDSGRIGASLADVEAAIKLPQAQCYAFVSDYLSYDKWQPSITDVESLALPGDTQIGSAFTVYYRIPVWGNTPYIQTVSYVDDGRTFAYESNGLVKVKTNITVRPKSEKVCFIRIQLSSMRTSLLFQLVWRPILSVYYQNWATQCLINVKMHNMHNF